MDELIKNIGNQILDAKTPQELAKILTRLETQPFCGLEKCYDLEHFVFHIIKPFQRDAVIQKISQFQTAKKPHIFTTLDYISGSDIKNGLLKAVDFQWITVLSSQPEKSEKYYRTRTPYKNAMISNLEPVGDDFEKNLELGKLEMDYQAQSVASQYIKVMLNNLKLFPNYQPIWMADASPVSILISRSLNRRAEKQRDFQWLGAILDNRSGFLTAEMVTKLQAENINVFHTNKELLDILFKVLNISG